MAKSIVAVTASIIIGLASPAWGQIFDIGQAEYQSSCATCHGIDGKGNGPMSAQLRLPPPDLTILAKKNNGVFPFSSVYEAIDGRKTILAHGTRDMPIWGSRFGLTQVEQSLRHFFPMDGAYAEYVARMRILAVIDYLNRIQEKQ